MLISKVETGSLAQAEGLREGDLVKEVNRVDTGSVAEFGRPCRRSNAARRFSCGCFVKAGHFMSCSSRPIAKARHAGRLCQPAGARTKV